MADDISIVRGYAMGDGHAAKYVAATAFRYDMAGAAVDSKRAGNANHGGRGTVADRAVRGEHGGHGLVKNAAALGVAARDRYWTRPLALPLDTPADDLAIQALAQPGGAVGRHLRIAAMHYPVADDATPGHIWPTKVLWNRQRFARDLQRHPSVTPLVAHLLLAGHTHMAFPGVGQLPRSASVATHTPLVAGQCQVVSASLSQEILPGAPLKANEPWAESCARISPYQCTVLRFYSQDHDPFEIIMDRAIAGADDTGIFSFLPLAPGSLQRVERMTFRL